MGREDIFQYVREIYGIEPDYPFPKFPTYPVLRHGDNRKWFGLIMDVPREKLGLSGTDYTDILNVKLDDSMLIDVLIREPGYFPGYHISRGKWVSILLDGTVPFGEICRWIDLSYENTASRQKKQRIRPAKEWLIPSNPKYYDIEHAFDTEDEIAWKQGAGIRCGDTVFLYVAAPVSSILYRCKVTETNIPFDYQDRDLRINELMKIRLEKRYAPGLFSFERMKNDFGIFAVRGPRGVPHSLSAALKQ